MRHPPIDALAFVRALESDPELAMRFAVALAPHVFGAAVLATSRPAGVYSSRKGHGAPGLSSEENRRVAQRIGTKRGRWYVYTAEQLEAYERAQLNAPAATSTWHPSMAAKGLRVLKASGR